MKVVGLVLTALLVSTPAFAQWSTAAKMVQDATVELTTDGGSCTAFVIDAVRDFVLTAAHCDGEEMYADQTPTEIVYKDVRRDLMVLKVEDVGDDRTALKLAKEDPKIGDEVASYGYGYAWERPMFRVAHISDDKTYVHEGGIGGPFLIIDGAFVGGQSGGPVVNEAGELVMIVQMASDRVGLGRGVEEIKDRVGKYFQKTP